MEALHQHQVYQRELEMRVLCEIKQALKWKIPEIDATLRELKMDSLSNKSCRWRMQSARARTKLKRA